MNIFSISFLLFIFLFVFQNLSAEVHDTALKLIEQKKYQDAEKLLKPLAEKGDLRAQYNMALILPYLPSSIQAKNSNEYLAMSKNSGLVDAYLIDSGTLDKLVNTDRPIEAQNTNGSQSVHSLSVHKTIKTSQEKVSSKSVTESSEITVSNSSNMELDIQDSKVWLLSQPAKSYTLQLATGKNREHLEKMRKGLLENKDLSDAHRVIVQEVVRNINDKTTIKYVLLFGSFKRQTDAKEAMQFLPESIQKSKPWIRQFRVLQSIVEKNESST